MTKLKTIEELIKIRHGAFLFGKKIVLTNGCYDILHVGHVRNLIEAKKSGDILIVAINSDESLKKLKKLSSPVTCENERAEILSALYCVDYVTIFGEPTADGIINLLRPDIYAKGTDYTPENIPERDSVSAYGGKIVITGDPKDHSTRDIIKKIKTEL